MADTKPAPEDEHDDEFVSHKITSVANSGTEKVFQFGKLTDAFKVRRQGFSLDYWVYDVVLSTNDEAYWDPPATTGLVKISTSRRYSEFEWLRKELAAYYPGAIIPHLPGLKMEGLLDKFKSLLLPENDSEPPIVVFRKRGLTLFLRWIQESPLLRASPLVEGFCKTNPREFEAFKKKWSEQKAKKDAMFETRVDQAKYNAKRLAQRKKDVLPDRLLAVRMLAEAMTGEMTELKDAVEDLWEIQGQNQSCYPLYPHLDVDEITHCLLECGRTMDEALNAKQTDTSYAKLLVLLAFYAGLCKSVLEAINKIEGLTFMLEEAKKDESESLGALEAAVKKAAQVFYDELAHWHAFRRDLCCRIPKKFSWLACHMDPTLFDWADMEKRIQQLQDAYADLGADADGEEGDVHQVNLGGGGIGDDDL